MIYQGENIAFQSKKNGAWLKPLPDASVSFVAISKTLDSNSMFFLETGAAGVENKIFQKDVSSLKAGFNYTIFCSAGEIKVWTLDRQPVSLSLKNINGMHIRSQFYQGGGLYSIGKIPAGSLGILVIKGKDFQRREMILSAF